jgi:hypothetical protein
MAEKEKYINIIQATNSFRFFTTPEISLSKKNKLITILPSVFFYFAYRYVLAFFLRRKTQIKYGSMKRQKTPFFPTTKPKNSR